MKNTNCILKLNNGVTIPALGFGTFAKDGTAAPGVMQAVVQTALEVGYRHFDAAWM
jgi:diketogulonate reductase-like aldo/keto reductase